MASNHKNVRTRLRLWRQEAGLSLADAAKKLGVSKASLGPIEVGRLRPTRAMAGRIEGKFGEPIAELLKPTPRGTVPRLLRPLSEIGDAIVD